MNFVHMNVQNFRYIHTSQPTIICKSSYFFHRLPLQCSVYVSNSTSDTNFFRCFYTSERNTRANIPIRNGILCGSDGKLFLYTCSCLYFDALLHWHDNCIWCNVCSLCSSYLWYFRDTGVRLNNYYLYLSFIYLFIYLYVSTEEYLLEGCSY